MQLGADHGSAAPVCARIVELVREAALEGVRDELPHSIAVVVEEMVPRADRPDAPALRAVAEHLPGATVRSGRAHV